MKFIFQILFALAILPLSVWLFTLIPTPSDMTPNYGVLGLFVYPLALAFYVSVLGILAVSTWNLIAFIFKEEEHEKKRVSSTVSKKKKYNYQPSLKEQTKKLNIATQITANESRPTYIIENKKYNYQSRLKQQIQSLNTAAQMTGLAPSKEKIMQKKNNSLLFLTFKFVSWITGISFALAMAVYAFFALISLTSHSDKNKRSAYSAAYKTEDYNDSRIITYNDALKEASRELVDSTTLYGLFKADVKREIALKCIEVFSKEHNATVKITNFKLNARNHYTRTNMIKKWMKRENFLRDNSVIYKYPNSTVYGLENSSVGIESNCKMRMSVDTIFKNFMPFYIKGQQQKLDNLRIIAIIDSSSTKDFKAQEKWVKILHEKKF